MSRLFVALSFLVASVTSACGAGDAPVSSKDQAAEVDPLVACGKAGQPCCRGISCSAGAFCADLGGGTKCLACGKPGQACCDGTTCVSGSTCENPSPGVPDVTTCSGATAVPGGCGFAGGPCCAGSVCTSGVLCNRDVQTCVTECGTINNPCCASTVTVNGTPVTTYTCTTGSCDTGMCRRY